MPGTLKQAVLALFLGTISLCLPLQAQDRAAINGAVTDPSGAIVPGASVDVDSTATGLHRTAITSAAGLFEIIPLPVGSYALKISKDGFKPTTINNVDLQYGETRTVDAKLEVGTVAESVMVEATAEAVDRTTAEVGGVIESEQIKEIPISGRNWASLMLLAPGAINYGDGAQRSIRFDGHSLDDSNFTFDGVDTSGVQEQTQKADARLNIALDAIQEFRVSTFDYTAESGAAGGAQINVVSKAGTNQLHGSLFYALRRDELDSRSPFDGPTLPPFSLHQFGASIGGPIKKDKAFFYTNYEGLRQSLGETLDDAFVPSASFRAQVLAKSPVLKPILDGYPLGQPTNDPTTNLVSGSVATDTVREDSGMARFDYRFDDNNSAYVRYNVDDTYADTPTDSLGGHNVLPLRPTNVVLQYQRSLSPTMINELKFGLNRANYHNFGFGTSPIAVTINGSDFASVSDTSLDTEVGTTFSYIDNLTKIAGRHTLKFGVDIRRIRLNNSGNTLTTSSITYDTPADFMNNNASAASYLQGEGVVGNRRTFYQGYAQDEFRATPELTLNLGLRYEFYSVAHEILDRSAVVDITACGGFCPKGTAYYDPNYKDFGPRLGMAWAPEALHGKTSIRAGFGIYYGGNQNDDFSDPAESAVPRFNIQASNLSYPILPFLVPGTNQAPKAIDRHRKDLYYENWDLVLQQQLPHDWLLQVGYTGGEGHHLFDKYSVNLINPVTGSRPLVAFGSFGLKANDGNNNFSALQISVNRRFTHGLLFQTNYMWSHGITDGSNGSGDSAAIQNMACRACDRSNSSIDVRQSLTSNFIYELPFGKGKQFLTSGMASHVFGGWEISGIVSARSGLPVNITLTRKTGDLPDGNTSGQRPDYVLGQSLYAANQTITGSPSLDPPGWFNAAAFATPAKGVWGNLGRYTAFGPGMYEIDSTLQKRFTLTERLALNFRASAYNLFNHPVYTTPNGKIGSSLGAIGNIINDGAVGSGAPRRFEFMFRAEF